MADTRELILARLFAIGQLTTGFVLTVRNRGLLSNEKRPALVLLDGDELPRLSIDTRRIKGRTSTMAPQIVQMRPEIYILLKEDRPNNDTVGQELNGHRDAYLSAVWSDAALAALIGSNGSMVYNGCVTDLKSGSSLTGQMRLDFFIHYVLRPTA